jgi:predicted nucleic acid-binding protein
MTTTGANACVVDTNVLVYSTVSGNPWHTQAREWLATFNLADFRRFDEIVLEMAPVVDSGDVT